MASPRHSLASSTSIVSTSSSDGELSEEDVVPQRPAPLPSSKATKAVETTVNIENLVMTKNSKMPGLLNGDLVNTHINNFIIHRAGDLTDVDFKDLATEAVKINSETFKSFHPSDINSASNILPGTKEDVEGLSRRWCYLISALVTLSLITLLGTAVLSLTSWRTSQGAALSPAIKTTVDGLSAEEKQFAGIANGPRIITRPMWLAAPSSQPLDRNTLPVSLVVVCHTETGNCRSQPECVDMMRAMQRGHQEKLHFADLGYNFLIGGDNSVYWSRGFDYMGAHTKRFNNGSIGVAFIGRYFHAVPSAGQIEAFNKLIQVGLQQGKIALDYTLVAQCQIRDTDAPGLALARDMASWPHYNSSLPVRCSAP